MSQRRHRSSNTFVSPRAVTRAYEVSGFPFETGEPFPELAETASPPVSRFCMRAGMRAPFTDVSWFHHARLADGRSWPAFGKVTGGYVLDFEGACAFAISVPGDRIDGYAAPGMPASTVRRLFLDQVIPLVLNLRGKECVHASAVLIGGAAHAFIGASGAGKSTLAAALAGPARPLLSDDCLALATGPEGILAYSGNRGSKLWPDSAQALCEKAEALARVAGHDEKRLLDAATAAPRSARLSRIYVLQRAAPGTTPVVREAQAAEAVPTLLEAAFRLDVTDTAMLERQFRFLMDAASSVPLRLLRYGHDFAALPAVCEMVIADAEMN